MGLRIRTNVASLSAQRNLGLTTNAKSESMGKLASGYRINKSADDAAGLAITETMKAKVRSMDVARRNANDGVSMLQVAEGSMNEVSSILVRLRELAVQSASDTIGNTERSYTNREYVQLVDEIDRISNSTDFNGIKLLGGSDEIGLEELTIHVDAGNGKTPNTDTISFNVNEFQINAEEILGLQKGSEIGPLQDGDSFLRESASEKIDVIDRALSLVASNRATIGAKQSRLQSAINNIGVKIENTQAAKSRIKDVDFAAETATLTQMNILSQAGTSVLSQANNAPELALALLR